ncbi:hypothetical protein T12_4270 [Trichinella patagoniensis]|uniref:Uncharacterized protein n=1 Tax=Trichinella patagoniensis TaxID=990121 RepID=A0A0V0YZF6_9BILA|nr:hypothetical protein T12_4270 [Trichinella patagoniensis]
MLRLFSRHLHECYRASHSSSVGGNVDANVTELSD